MFILGKSARISLLLAAAIFIPLLLNGIYVLALRGRAASPNALHIGCLAVIVLSCVPFIAVMPTGQPLRIAVATVFVAVHFFMVGELGFAMCVWFGYPP